ncbi:MAG: hypothetical protein HQL10_12265 [Nitrospirae bacterium]|nr:hypothetical protein [Nitrospirota bacterium]
MPALITILILSLLGIQGIAYCSEEAMITIVKAVWTSGIDDTKNPVKIYENSVSQPRRLYLWTKVRGGSEALRVLKNEGKLPIRHKWYSYIGPTAEFDDSREPIDAVNLSVGKKEKLNRLASEVDIKGGFDWRTWSMKVNIHEGWWKVRIVYDDGENVICDGNPCEYVIQVK